MPVRLLAFLLVLLALAGCGGTSAGEGGEAGTAALWVTRDRGAEVVLTAEVPAGLTVLQALDQVADIETRYGGRFVQAIEGIEGSLARRRDWFYFLNGIEPDVGAAEVRLRAGDVAWWDFRSWSGEMQQPVVVGAFPEPFRHGWDGQDPAPRSRGAARAGRRGGRARGVSRRHRHGQSEPLRARRRGRRRRARSCPGHEERRPARP